MFKKNAWYEQRLRMVYARLFAIIFTHRPDWRDNSWLKQQCKMVWAPASGDLKNSSS